MSDNSNNNDNSHNSNNTSLLDSVYILSENIKSLEQKVNKLEGQYVNKTSDKTHSVNKVTDYLCDIGKIAVSVCLCASSLFPKNVHPNMSITLGIAFPVMFPTKNISIMPVIFAFPFVSGICTILTDFGKK